MRRRTIIVSGAAAIGLLGCSTAKVSSASSDVADAPAIDPGSGPLSAVIEYQGSTFQYNEANGTDLGDYDDPARRFVQRCTRATHDHFPVSVFFRPDRDTHRAEIVFELGNPWSKEPPQNLDSYRVTIIRGDRHIATVTVPQHFWYSRWRWQSARRPVEAKVSDLIRTGLLPHYDASVLGRYARQPRYTLEYSPMTLAGVTPNMGQTGERPDIGPVTEWQADYICEGTNLHAVLAQAEAAGTLNIHVRDPNTGAPIDLINTYPKAGNYAERTNSPYISVIPTRVDGRPLQFDTGHNPSLNYLPFLLTGDPYYLEELQFQVNAALMGPAGGHYTAKGRYLAWPLRDKFHAAKVTPASVPKWLLPQSYFRSIVDGQRSYIASTYVANDSDPRLRIFRLITAGGSQPALGLPGGTYFDPWQEDFTAFIFGWGVQLGFTEWTDALNWKIDCTTQRTNGTSGWPRARPTWYEVTFQPGCVLAAPVEATDTTIQVDMPKGFLSSNFVVAVDAERMLVTGGERTNSWTVTRGYAGTRPAPHAKGRAVTGELFTSWADCWASNAAVSPEMARFMPGDPTGMNELIHTNGGSVTYTSYTRGALAMAARLGVQSAIAPYTWLDRQMKDALSPQYQPERKWMVT